MTTKEKKPKAPVNKLENYLDVEDTGRLAKRIAEGADVNALIGGSRSGTAPIEMAAERQCVESVRMLLAAGAKPEWGGKYRKSALSKAIAKDSDEEKVLQIAEMLIAAGANPNGIPQEKGDDLSISESTVYLAAVRGAHKVMELLAKSGADIDVKTYTGGHSVFVPRKYAHTLEWLRDENNGNRGGQSMMVTLLRLGADEQCLKGEKTTAFQQCVALGLDTLVEYYVRERGEDLAQRVNGRTLVQHARNESTRALLKSLKTVVAVEEAMGEGSVEPIAPKRPVGMSPL